MARSECCPASGTCPLMGAVWEGPGPGMRRPPAGRIPMPGLVPERRALPCVLHLLQPAIAVVLGFIGAKLLADFFGENASETQAGLTLLLAHLPPGQALPLAPQLSATLMGAETLPPLSCPALGACGVGPWKLLRDVSPIFSRSFLDLNKRFVSQESSLGNSDGSCSCGFGPCVAGYEISTETSLFVVATLLGGGVFLSLRFPKEDKGDSL